MSYQVHVLGGLFVLRWGEPEVGDANRYAAELAKASQEQNTKLVGLFIMPEGSPSPGEDFRKEQAAALDAVMDRLHFAVAVFEGSGFATSMKRSALVAILLLTSKRQKIVVRSTVEEALVTNPPHELHFDGAKALRQLQARGMCDEPYEVPHARSA